MKYALWVYIELPESNPVVYNTFLTAEQAEITFSGHYDYFTLEMCHIEWGLVLKDKRHVTGGVSQ